MAKRITADEQPAWRVTIARSFREQTVLRACILLVFVTPMLLSAPAAQSSQQSSTDVQQQVDRLFGDAQSDFARGDYLSAAQKYQRAAALQPNSPEALNNLGAAYHMAGRLPEAVKAFQEALRLNPNLRAANLLLGIDLIKMGNAEGAIPPLQRVIHQNSADREALLALASAYFARQDFDLATEVYQHELKVRPDDADAWYGLGLCFEHTAENTTRQLAKVGANSSYNVRLLGEFLNEQDADIEAEEAFRRALELASAAKENNEGLHAALGFVHLGLGEAGLADIEFNDELESHPGNLDAKMGLAAVATEQGNISAAIQSLCAVFNSDKDYFQSRVALYLNSLEAQRQEELDGYLKSTQLANACSPAIGLLQQKLHSAEMFSGASLALEPSQGGPQVRQHADGSSLGQAQEAVKSGRYSDCAEALEREPHLGEENALLLARCACLSGRLLVAFRAAKGALDNNSRNFAAAYWKAEAARRLAQICFERGVTLKPDSWQGHILFGDIYRQQRNWELAISNYEAAARLNPKSPAPFLGLAAVFWRTGQYEGAESQLQKVLALDADNSLAEFMLGDIFVRQHRFEEAIPHLKKTLSHEPQLLAAHADLGNSYAALDRAPEAIAELTRAIPMDHSGDIHYQLYKLYKKEGQFKLAQEALAESQRLRTEESQTQQRRLNRAEGARKATHPPH